MSQHTIRPVVNGEPVEVRVAASRRLAELVRDDLGLTGTKLSCETQVCGACTVLVDGLPVSSCTYLAVDVDGRDVTTIEGIGYQDHLVPLQQALLDHGAVQCGFCTPGIVLSVIALLADGEPSDEAVRHHLDGNLCRCTGYEQILEAVLSVVHGSRGVLR